jgi:hypothetical protein
MKSRAEPLTTLCRRLKIAPPAAGESTGNIFERIGFAYAFKQGAFQIHKGRGRGRPKNSVTKSEPHALALKLIEDVQRQFPKEKRTAIETMVIRFLEERGIFPVPENGADTLRGHRNRIRRLEMSRQKARERVAMALIKANSVQ